MSLHCPTHKRLSPGPRPEPATRTPKADRPSLPAATSGPGRKKRFAWCMRTNWLGANHCACERGPTPLGLSPPGSACPALGVPRLLGLGRCFSQKVSQPLEQPNSFCDPEAGKTTHAWQPRGSFTTARLLPSGPSSNARACVWAHGSHSNFPATSPAPAPALSQHTPASRAGTGTPS